MPLLECREITKDFGGRLIFEGLSFSVEPNQKIALIGANGAGKTSLLRIIMGEDDDFSGKVIRQSQLRMTCVAQRFQPPPGASALDCLLEPITELRARLAAAELAMDGADPEALSAILEGYGHLREEYEALKGDDAEDEGRRLLERAGLGASADSLATSLSGGEANILGLLRAILCKPNLLLLDEPGNHLDLWGQAWLEDYLKNLPMALILVSHNRWLIDRVAQKTLSIEGCTLKEFPGGYSAARLEKLKRAAAAGAGWQADRKKLERLEALVKRFAQIAAARPDPAWGKRLRARRSQLEREKAQARQRPELGEKAMDLSFQDNDARSTFALIVQGYSKAFGQRTLIRDSGFDILRGEKIALVGRNGSGKTSFILDLLAQANWDSPVLRVSPSMRLGYVSQSQDTFRPERLIREEFESLGARPQEIQALLKRFLFEYEDLGRRVRELSGGELNRLQLARAVYLKANFLILDEPTNHLDIASREAVEEALTEFDGTILLVSHDRFLLEAVADRVVFIDECAFKPYEGGFSEYWRDVGLSRLKEIDASKGLGNRAQALKGGKTAASDSGKTKEDEKRQKLSERIEELEKDREMLEKQAKVAIEGRDFALGRKKAAEIEALERLIEKLYQEWCA